MDNTTKTKTNSFNDHDSEAFLLMEATGDSDEVLDPNMNNDNYHDNDDDAESCSFDASVSSSSSCLLQDLVGEGNDNEVEVKNEDNVVDHVGGTWSGSGRDVVDKFMVSTVYEKSCVSKESVTSEDLNEMEKSRLFWETCLAS